MNYEKDMQIDESALDVEWLGQAQLMMEYARHSVTARAAADHAKERLAIRRAELDTKIRQNPDDFITGKVTEGAINATILLNLTYQEAHEEFLELESEAALAKCAVQAVQQRKDALENLVRLHGQGYFASPSMPRDLSDEYGKRLEERRKEQAGKIASRRKQRKENM